VTDESGFGTRDSGFGPDNAHKPADAEGTTGQHDPAPGDGDAIRLPIDGTLDLHAFKPADATSVLDEYLREARAAGLAEVRVVHGRGRGVLRGMVQAALEANPLVEAFRDDPASYLGATIVRLGSGR
jgi:dsDNA-specific endonuclease/ATPase MutS2